MSKITFENQIKTENNEIQIAEKRYRILAFIIDFCIYEIIVFILGLLFGTPLKDEVGYNLNGLPALGAIIIGIFLWPISEVTWGQTIGKRILDLKVVSNDFTPIGIKQAFSRFFLGIIDFIFLIGIIIATNNKQNKRVGDLVANTIVIRFKKIR